MAGDHEITHVNTRPEAAASLIDDVRLDEQVGAGLSSTVYRGFNLLAGRPCAVKLLRPELGVGPVRRGRYFHEAEEVSAFGHAGVADVFRFGVAADGRSYALSEWVDGTSLRSLVRHNAPLSRRAFLPLLRQLAAILGGLHAAGFAHRRLHAGNIVVAGEGNDVRLKLLDFGVWRVHPAVDGEADVAVARKAEHAIAIAPEIGKGEEGDARSDVYALGVLLYEMLTGKVPFLGETFAQTVAQHISEDPMPPSQVVAMPTELEGAIMRALEKDAKKRTPSVQALLSSLGALVGTSAQHAVVARPPQPRAGRVRDLTSGETPLLAQSGPQIVTPSGGGAQAMAPGLDRARTEQGIGEPLVPPPASFAQASPLIEPAALRPPKRKLWLFVTLGVALLAFGGAMAYILIDKEPPKRRRRVRKRVRRRALPRRVAPPRRRTPRRTAPPPTKTPTKAPASDKVPLKKGPSKAAVKRFQRRFGGSIAPLHTAKLVRGFGEIVITTASPRAQMFLDGRYVGTAQRKVLRRIPIGRHRLHVVINGKRSRHKDITLLKGRRVSVGF